MKNEIEEVNYIEDDEPSIAFTPAPSMNTTTITNPPPIPTIINFTAPQIPDPQIQSAGAIMPAVIEPKEKKVSVERLMEGENLKNVIKTIFQNAEVMTCEVKKGAKSSSNIYVHKRYTGKRATVIIWND